MKILISIINFNSYKEIFYLIKQIYDIKLPKKVKITILIIDNSEIKKNNIYIENNLEKYSYQLLDSIKELELKNIQDIIYYKMDKNLGFAGTHNISIDFVLKNDFSYIWLLNTDVILDNNILISLLKCNEQHLFSILGSVIYDYDTKKLSSIGVNGLNSWRGYKSVKVDKVNNDECLKVDGVIGTSIFIPRIILEKIRFDDKYFLYVEENDFCYRAKKQGFDSYAVLNSKIYHKSGGTFKKEEKHWRWYYKVRNLLYFKKSQGNDLNFILIPYLFISTIKNYGLNIKYLKAYFYGVVDYLNNRRGKLEMDL